MSNDIHIKQAAQQTSQFIQNAGEKTTEKVIQEAHKYSDVYHVVDKMVDGFWERVPYIIIGIIVFFLFWLFAEVFKFFIRRTLMKRTSSRQNLVLVLNRVGSTFILFFGFLIALVIIIPGFSPAQLVSALGIGSVAIGFAFKDIFQNLLSGILILLGEPFRIGDVINIDGLEGTVEDIEIRATFLRSFDGRRIVIPNSTVYTSAVIVNTAYAERRCEFTVGISYDDDVNRAKEIIQQVLQSNPHVLADPAYTIQVSALADFSVNIMVRWWINTNKIALFDAISEVQTEVKTAFNRHGISIPYPIQELNIRPTNNVLSDAAESSSDKQST